MLKRKNIFYGLIGCLVSVMGFFISTQSVSAFSVTPMKQSVSLVPGDTYTGRVTLYESSGAGDLYYNVSIQPVSVDDSNRDYAPVFGQMTGYTDIVNWVSVTNGEDTAGPGESLKGMVPVNEAVDISFTINVPENVRGGGQYFAVKMSSRPRPNNDAQGNVAISDTSSIASIIYAEVAGDVTIKGSIEENDFPGFVLNPPLQTSFLVKNEGNTHALITYYMQVFPMFSDEEIYTTEEDPDTKYVLPGTKRYITQTWDKAPSVGIFKVRQTVYYNSTDGEPSVTEKMVIICPIWLLFVIFFVIAVIIIWIVMSLRKHGKKSRRGGASSSQA